MYTEHNAQEHIRYELQGVQKTDHRGNRSRNGKFWKFSLKMSLKAVLTRSSMRGFTMGKKGLQLTFIILSRTLSEMSKTAVTTLRCDIHSHWQSLSSASVGDRRMNEHVPEKWLRWSRGSVLAFSTQVRGFAPGRSRRIFRAKKSSARLPSEGK